MLEFRFYSEWWVHFKYRPWPYLFSEDACRAYVVSRCILEVKGVQEASSLLCNMQTLNSFLKIIPLKIFFLNTSWWGSLEIVRKFCQNLITKQPLKEKQYSKKRWRLLGHFKPCCYGSLLRWLLIIWWLMWKLIFLFCSFRPTANHTSKLYTVRTICQSKQPKQTLFANSD